MHESMVLLLLQRLMFYFHFNLLLPLVSKCNGTWKNSHLYASLCMHEKEFVMIDGRYVSDIITLIEVLFTCHFHVDDRELQP